MCRFNTECEVQDGSCNCMKKRTSAFKVNPDLACPRPTQPLQNNFYFPLFRLLQQQSEAIKLLSEQGKTVIEKLSSISNQLQHLNSTQDGSSPVIVPYEEVTSSSRLCEILCGQNTEFQYFLKLISEVPSPAYKERAFPLLAQIVDKDGNNATLPSSVFFKILLFTTESPPKLMKTNTGGDKIMRGTVEIETTSALLFRKIVIKEVTSHFRNGCFFLVIMPKQASHIKPLIIENFIIKARKVNAQSLPLKKVKKEGTESTESYN